MENTNENTFSVFLYIFFSFPLSPPFFVAAATVASERLAARPVSEYYNILLHLYSRDDGYGGSDGVSQRVQDIVYSYHLTVYVQYTHTHTPNEYIVLIFRKIFMDKIRIAERYGV